MTERRKNQRNRIRRHKHRTGQKMTVLFLVLFALLLATGAVVCIRAVGRRAGAKEEAASVGEASPAEPEPVEVEASPMKGTVEEETSEAEEREVLPVSGEVESYDALIHSYAGAYGIEEYVPLIKAVMMQESEGRGLDPMQTSESPFNTQKDQEPGSITSPEYSIDCGVQELKSMLEEAGCTSPDDLDKIRLALQGYNYGNDYIQWALARDGGYTEENVWEFQDEMVYETGWDSYGDPLYVQKVLKYYPVNP